MVEHQDNSGHQADVKVSYRDNRVVHLGYDFGEQGVNLSLNFEGEKTEPFVWDVLRSLKAQNPDAIDNIATSLRRFADGPWGFGYQKFVAEDAISKIESLEDTDI